MAEAIRSRDWSKSPLGAITTWPRALKSVLGNCLRTRVPAAILWRREFVLLFNDAMHSVIGDDADQRLGRPLAEVEEN
jgi:hypothetical protein